MLRGGIRPLLFPRSVAVVGASDRTGSGTETFRGATRGGIDAWAVNPARDEVLGYRCYESVADLPEIPDLVFLLVNHVHVEQVFEEAVAAGVRAFVLPGLGAEAGLEGREIAARLAGRAAEVDAAVVGPNCMGVAVPDGASFWIGTVPETFLPGHVAVVSHAGSIGEALLAAGPRVGFRCVVSTGSELARDAADFGAFFAEDEGTRAVALFLETVRRPTAFKRALELLAEADKPVVCLKAGRSEAGARAALTHSGALVGSNRAFSALLRRYGAIEVDDYAELLETLEVLGRKRWPRGRRIAAVSNSGGEAVLLADHAEAAGLPFEPLPEELAAQLLAEFPNFVAPGNPLDAWAVDEAERVFPRCFELLAGSAAFDILLAHADQSQYLGAHERESYAAIAEALAEAVDGTETFAAVTSVQSSDPGDEVERVAQARDLALLRGPGNAMRAIAHVALRRRPRVVEAPPGEAVDLSDLLAGEGVLPEFESGVVLERYGIPVASRVRAASPEEAAAAAEKLGPRVVVKRDGPAHKSRDGGIILDLGSPAAAAEAAARLGGPVLVARQVPAGREVLCGMVRDPDYGPVLAVGPGGTAVETLVLPAIVLGPLDLESAGELAEDALGSLAEDERAALARTLVALGRLALDHPEVASVDVNPLILGPDGVIAVDALVVVAPAAT